MGTASLADVAVLCVDCHRCGARAGETCASALRRAADAMGDDVAARELAELEASGLPFLHPQRLEEAAELVRSAEACGLVERVAGGGA